MTASQIKHFAAWLLLFITLSCFGQENLLMLQKKNKNKNAYYKAGDVISFRVSGSEQKITGEILAVEDSALVFKGYKVEVSKITSLYIDEKTRWWLRYKLEQIFLLAGVGYLILDLINNGEVSKETLIITGASISVGLLAKLFIGNRIKIKGRTKLRILKLR